jgi:hypothetical protein
MTLYVALPWEIMPTQWSDDITASRLGGLEVYDEFVPCTGLSAG